MNREIIYKRDYSRMYDITEEESEQGDSLLEALAEEPAIQEAFARHRSNPHMLNPICKDIFECMVKEADAFTADFGGTIEAFIDYETYTANIDMVLPFFDVTTQSQQRFFAMAMAVTTNIDVSPALDEANIRVRLTLPYFIEISDRERDMEEAEAIMASLRKLRERFIDDDE